MKTKQTAMAAEAAVERKVAWIRNDQERRVLALEERQEKMLRHAQLAEAWADEVEKVTDLSSVDERERKGEGETETERTEPNRFYCGILLVFSICPLARFSRQRCGSVCLSLDVCA